MTIKIALYTRAGFFLITTGQTHRICMIKIASSHTNVSADNIHSMLICVVLEAVESGLNSQPPSFSHHLFLKKSQNSDSERSKYLVS